MTSDSAMSVAFLRAFRPEGPWVLTAIKVDRKAIETRTFRADGAEAASAWINEKNREHNIYFAINPYLREMSKKAEIRDIAEVTHLHVDIDPRVGESLDAERQRILHLLTDKLPAGVPPPSFVLDSGGGYWGLWRLRQPIKIGGDEKKAEDAKRYNVQLAVLFGADDCANIDRIARLPGTVNWPDERKLKKGRVPTLSTW